MDRRSFVLGGAVLAALPVRLRAQMPMRTKIALPHVVRQQCAGWCWAAAASMIFDSLGHPTDQKKIIEAAYGGSACSTDQQTGMITRALNADWLDDSGRQFHPIVEAVYDQQNGKVATNNAVILDELRQDRPLLYANTHHCMVIVETYHFPAMTGPNVVNVGVLDPWSDGQEFHLLSPPELLPLSKGGQMTYLATVRI